MEPLLDGLERYLLQTLGLHVVSCPWQHSAQLPHYLRDGYHFFETQLLSTKCILAVDADPRDHTPAVIAKQLGQVRSRYNVDVVYVNETLSPHNRKRLIEQKLPFVVPGHQLFFPDLGIDLREHLRQVREKRPVFWPATQLLLLHVLLTKPSAPPTPSEMARRLGYSDVTMTRAFDELRATGLSDNAISGRERPLQLRATGRTLWEQALPYLSTPVRQHFRVASLPQAVAWHTRTAGLSALAQYTLLAEPPVPIVALSAVNWRVYARNQASQGRVGRSTLDIGGQDALEPEGTEVEIWKYDPVLLSPSDCVDRLSLHLALRESTDERIQVALDELLEGVKW